MAYTDNRSEVSSDAFPSSIDSDWDNSNEWGAFQWFAAAGGFLNPVSGNTDTLMFQNTGTYDTDQYSTSEVHTVTYGPTPHPYGAAVRNQGGTDTACYVGCYVADSNAPDSYWCIYEADADAALTELTTAAPSTETGLAAGDTVTCEAEGTTIRVGGDIAGITGGDQEGTNTTDATVSGGRPGIYVYQPNTCRVNAWAGGDIEAAGTSVTATLGDLALGPLASTVNDKTTVTATLGNLALVPLNASVIAETETHVTATLGNLSLTPLDATVVVGVSTNLCKNENNWDACRTKPSETLRVSFKPLSGRRIIFHPPHFQNWQGQKSSR